MKWPFISDTGVDFAFSFFRSPGRLTSLSHEFNSEGGPDLAFHWQHWGRLCTFIALISWETALLGSIL